jgi:hypothetical protein
MLMIGLLVGLSFSGTTQHPLWPRPETVQVTSSEALPQIIQVPLSNPNAKRPNDRIHRARANTIQVAISRTSLRSTLSRASVQ